jgi:hypothetical protein
MVHLKKEVSIRDPIDAGWHPHNVATRFGIDHVVIGCITNHNVINAE